MKWTDLNRPYQDRLTALAAMTPYDLLEVTEGVSEADLRSAYLAKVKAYHPDRADEFVRLHSEKVLKLVNSAYDQIRRDRGYGN